MLNKSISYGLCEPYTKFTSCRYNFNPPSSTEKKNCRHRLRSHKLAPVYQTEATRQPKRFVSVCQGTEDKLSAVQ